MLASLALLQASVTVGPASMSLPELASALTRTRMPTECSPALRQRAALVSLHGRSPEAARRTLSEALGVAFVPQSKGWRMVVDDAARERDRKLLIAYEAAAARTAAAWAEAERKGRGGLDYVTLAARTEEQAGLLREGQRTNAAVAERVAPTVALARRAQPNTWIAAAALRDGEFVRQAVAEGMATKSFPAASVESATGVPLAAYLPEARRVHADLGRAGELTAVARFDALQGTLLVQSYLQVGDKQVSGVRTFQNAAGHEIGGTIDGYGITVDVEPGSAEATFDAMGPLAANSLKRLAPAPALPERPILEPAPWTLSSGLERLCATGNQDLAMALSPRFEAVPRDVPGGVKPPALSFRSAFTPKTGRADGPPEYGYYAAQGLLSGAVDAVREQRARRRHPWRAVDRDGVWLVVNPYGFLDRTRPISPVPFLKAERALREQGGGAIPEAPTIATARRIGGLFSWPDLGAFHDVLGYRDLDLENDVALLGMLWRLDGALPAAQGAFWRDLRVHRAATVETSQGPITLRLDGDESAPNVVGGYLFPGTAAGGSDLGYVRFDGRGSVLP